MNKRQRKKSRSKRLRALVEKSFSAAGLELMREHMVFARKRLMAAEFAPVQFFRSSEFEAER